MFDISWGELILVGMVALIVIGPKELPTVLRTVGQWMTKVRRMAAEFQGQFQEAMREAELSDLKKQVDSISDPVKSFTDYNPLETAKSEFEKAFEDKPKTAADTSSAADTSPGVGANDPSQTTTAPTNISPVIEEPPYPPPAPEFPEPAEAARAALDGGVPSAPSATPPPADAPAGPAPVADAPPQAGGGRAA